MLSIVALSLMVPGAMAFEGVVSTETVDVTPD